MEFLVETRSVKKRKFIEAILPSMIKQLKLENSKKVLLVRVANECDGQGMTMPLNGLDAYVIVVKPGWFADMGATLAHEMVHVRQMAKGILKVENGVNYWRGKKYSKKTKYLDMPWEQDAFSKQELIFRRAVE